MLTVLAAVFFTLAFYGCKKNAIEPDVTSDAKTGKMSTLTLSCGTATASSIELNVCTPLGGTGAPSGFSVQCI